MTGCYPKTYAQKSESPHITIVRYEECPEYKKTEKIWYGSTGNSVHIRSEESLYDCPLEEDQSYGCMIIDRSKYTEDPKNFITDGCFAEFYDVLSDAKYYQLARVTENGTETCIVVPQSIYNRLRNKGVRL